MVKFTFTPNQNILFYTYSLKVKTDITSSTTVWLGGWLPLMIRLFFFDVFSHGWIYHEFSPFYVTLRRTLKGSLVHVSVTFIHRTVLWIVFLWTIIHPFDSSLKVSKCSTPFLISSPGPFFFYPGPLMGR